MNACLTGLELVASWIWRVSWQSSVLVGLILLVHCCCKARLSPIWRSALWLLVLIRLVFPFSLPANFSVFNYAHFPSMPAPAASAITPLAGEHPVRPRLNLSPSIRLEGTQPVTTTIPLARGNSVAPPVANLSNMALSWNMRQILGLAWVVTILALALRLFIAVCCFHRALRRSRKISAGLLQRLFDDCCRAMRVRRPPSLLEMPGLDSPALFGLFRPRLLLPWQMEKRFTAAEFRHVFLHELAHLRRGDLFINWLIVLLQIVHWFNPILWFAFWRMRADREVACDDFALRHAGERERVLYGQTILKILEQFSGANWRPGFVGILEDKTQLQERLMRIVHSQKSRAWSALGALLLGTLAAVTFTDAQTNLIKTLDPALGLGAGTNGVASVASFSPHVRSKIQEAKLLEKAGKLSEARTVLMQVVAEERQGPAALYCWDLADQLRFKHIESESSNSREGSSSLWPSGLQWTAVTNVLNPAVPRQRIYQKLNQIVSPEVSYKKLPLSEVIRDLNDESRKLDPERVGINFIWFEPKGTDRSHGFKIADVLVDIDPPLRRVRLGDLCDVISKATIGPDGSAVRLRFSVEDYAVVFTYKTDEGPQLYWRELRLEPQTTIQSLRAVLGSRQGTNAEVMMREFLATAGLDWATEIGIRDGKLSPQIDSDKLPNGKSVFFNEHNGLLFARATLEELDLIEKAVNTLNASPAQVSLATKIVEVDGGNLGTNPLAPATRGAAGTAPSFGGAPSAKTPAGVFPGLPKGQTSGSAPGVLLGSIPAVTARPAAAPMLTGILSESEYARVLGALETRPGARVLPTPPAVTVSGKPLTVTVYDGSVLELLPVVLPDRTQIRMSLQYSGPPQIQKLPGQASPPSSNALVQVRIDTEALVADGHTLVLSGERQASGNSASALAGKKEVLIFITPTVVDAAGNRIHAQK